MAAEQAGRARRARGDGACRASDVSRSGPGDGACLVHVVLRPAGRRLSLRRAPAASGESEGQGDTAAHLEQRRQPLRRGGREQEHVLDRTRRQSEDDPEERQRIPVHIRKRKDHSNGIRDSAPTGRSDQENEVNLMNGEVKDIGIDVKAPTATCDDKNCPFARCQAPRNFIGEVHMAWRIN